MSDNVSECRQSAGKSPQHYMQCLVDPSETTRRSPLTHERGEIIAYLHGAMHDASLNKGKRIRFVQKYPDWLKTLQKLLADIGSRSWIYKEGQNRDLYVLETICHELDFSFDPSDLSEVDEKMAYLRGFFDAEGGIPRNGKRFYIQLTQKDYEKMRKIKDLLNSLDIRSGKLHNPSKRIDPNYWRIFISSDSHYRFASIIGSYHPIKNGIMRKRMKI